MLTSLKGKQHLLSQIKGYENKNIFNVDKTDHFYIMQISKNLHLSEEKNALVESITKLESMFSLQLTTVVLKNTLNLPKQIEKVEFF